MPVVRLPPERTFGVGAIFIVFYVLPVGGEGDAVATVLFIVGMLVDHFEQVEGFTCDLMVMEGQRVLCQPLHHVGHWIQLFGGVDDFSFTLTMK